MTHAIRFHKAGGPEVLVWEEVSVGKPGPGEARIRHTAVGLNFVDIYNRSGLYPAPLPSGLGSEGAGVVEEVGAGVSDLKPGDRVAYGSSPLGAYADERVMPADRLVPIPDGITDQQAAAPARNHAHVSGDHEDQATHHLSFDDIVPAAEDHADAVGGLGVVGHGPL